MNKYNKGLFLSIFLFFLLLSSCSKYSIEPPAGFASLEKKDTVYYFSPDGIKMKVSCFKNKPERDSEFWGEALKRHLEKKGYRLFKSAENDADRNTNYWIIAYGKDYYIYMTSVYSNRRGIVVLEAAGKKSLFEKYSDVIEGSAGSVRLK